LRKGLALSAIALAIVLTSAINPTFAQVAPTDPPPTFVRGVFGRDTSATGTDNIAATGFNTVTVSPLNYDISALDERGLKGLVWLWDYNNKTCSFQRSDAWVRDRVLENVNNPAVVAYQIADEPNAILCPSAPDQLAARTELIHDLHPGVPTYISISIKSGNVYFPYEYFVDSVDILGLVVYPCSWKRGCRFGMINTAIREARADGVGRFWAVMQDFGKPGAWYRQPTADELAEQFDRWADSGLSGYLVYHWGYGELDSRPSHLAVLAQQNDRLFPSTVALIAPNIAPTAPGNLTSSWSAPDVRLAWEPSLDDAGVAFYEVFEDGRLLATTTSHEWRNRWPVLNGHVYSVVAVDADGNRSLPAETDSTANSTE
jgi:hypothetical protein